MTRPIHAYVLSLAAVYCFGALACSSSNDPSTNKDPGTAGAPATGTAGATGAPVVGTAGAPATGAAGASVGGSDSSTAGAPAGTAGALSGTAGAPAGTAGAPAGTAGAGGTGTTYTPLCAGLTTAAGPAPTKMGACTAADPQLCYKTCGPQSVGFKSETCTAGAYAEQSGCSFPPDADYSCFKLPTTQDASCPATTPVASTPCTVAACTLCADATGHYLDSSMMSKIGYCVCPASTTGTSKWSCSSSTAWPCPTGKGC